MSLREEYEKTTIKKFDLWEYINWLEKRDEEREKLLSKERQAKEELLEALRKCQKRLLFIINVNAPLLGKIEKEKAYKENLELEQLIAKHTEKDKER